MVNYKMDGEKFVKMHDPVDGTRHKLYAKKYKADAKDTPGKRAFYLNGECMPYDPAVGVPLDRGIEKDKRGKVTVTMTDGPMPKRLPDEAVYHVKKALGRIEG
jgi:hypothetical protein